MTENEIHEICKKYKIKNYTINSDMSVDVDGDVKLYNYNLRELPLLFGKVTGRFDCSINELTTLKGCPHYVGNDFDCSDNNLTSLKGCPHYVGITFSCSSNKLSSLEYCPSYVGKYFTCVRNKLTTLNHLPINFHIGDDFYCLDNIDIKDPKDFGRLFFGYIDGKILTDYDNLNEFLNKHKNPPKKDLPKILSELRKIIL